MPRDENSMPLDKFFKEKESEYEDGRDREHDRELDEMMWELGDYQSEEPLGEMKEFEEESPAEEMLTEKEMLRSGKRVYLKEPEGVDTRIPVGRRLVGVKSLRIGLESSDCEIVCGYNVRPA